MKYAKQTPFRARACSPLTPSAPRPGIARGRLRACPARGYLDGSVRRDVPDAPGGRMGMSGIGAAARADGAAVAGGPCDSAATSAGRWPLSGLEPPEGGWALCDPALWAPCAAGACGTRSSRAGTICNGGGATGAVRTREGGVSRTSRSASSREVSSMKGLSTRRSASRLLLKRHDLLGEAHIFLRPARGAHVHEHGHAGHAGFNELDVEVDGAGKDLVAKVLPDPMDDLLADARPGVVHRRPPYRQRAPC